MDKPQTWKQTASRKHSLRNERLKPYMVSDLDQRLPQVHDVQERSQVVFEDALTQARALDRAFQETGHLKGPLHGVPVTLKDQFNIKGVDTTLGYWAETDNPLWGLTVNPRDPRLTPGGSTGGEAALLALHGTLLGFGTDIGGRVPVSTEGQEHVPSSIGPMARDLASIVYVSRSVADAKPWELDPKCTPLPWNEDTFQEIQIRPIVVGLILDDGVVRIHPPIERALRELSAKLQAKGHEVVIWDALDHFEYIQLMDQYYTVDGGEDIRRDIAVAGEPFIPHVEALVNRSKAISVYEYWQLNKQKVALQKRYLDKWNAIRSPSGRPVDILLAPTTPHPAVPHRRLRWVGYTKIWNLLDYPAVTFPVDEVRVAVDGVLKTYQPRNELDAWNWDLYDVKAMEGHPINVQVIGKKLNEEKVLGAATVIERIWRGL
ncbi:unnamed protein product [Aspergillus oryzae]|nr:unnamed protein product [Aspergillus oryzae]GMF91162.1 unnamed protein product [Aspergillus oryzae]